MRNGKRCPKCGSPEIGVVDPGLYNSFPVGLGGARLERYVCLSCGFTEEWVERRAMEKVRNYYGTSCDRNAGTTYKEIKYGTDK